MKKSILSALALATMVGACTNEDFEVVQNAAVPGDVTALNGRAKGELTLTAGRMDINEEATRVDGNIWEEEDKDGNIRTGINWFWRDGNDKLGGVVVDYMNKNNDIVNKTDYPKYAITNYPFAPGITGPSAYADFSTPTAVVEGAYFFYSQYNGKNTARGTISDEIKRLQTVNHGADAGLVQIGSNENGGENFFISPIVNVAVADGSNVTTPLSLTSAHAVLHITLTADLESKYIGENGLSVHKIVLQNVGGSEFKLENTIDPYKLGEIQKVVRDELILAKNDLYKAFELRNNGNTAVIKHVDSEVVKAAQAAVLEYLTRKGGDVPVIGTQDGGKTSSDLVYQLEEPFVYTTSDSEMDLFVIVPTGKYNGTDDVNLPEYNGKKEGALRMTVYTSEGTYDCYLGSKNGLTFYRNQKINVTRELIINADKTNINLFDPNDGFKIETTEDYEYAIDYINAHYRDFGNSSDWKAPILNFVGNPTIEVKEGYYFPTFRTEYNGEATLKLKVADGSSYVFNPAKTIFGTQAKPTIVIEDKTSSISFAAAIPAADGTQSVELVSAGDVNVAHNIVFDELNSKQALNIAKKVTVTIADTDAAANGALNIGDEAKVNAAGKLNTNSVAVGKGAQLNVTTDLTTKGTVLLDEGAEAKANKYFSNAGTTTMEANSKLDVAADFVNSADITIKGTAVATLNGESTNYGDIIVEGMGKLDSKSKFTNKKNGLVEVQEVALTTIDNKARGIAKFVNLTNEAGAEVYAKKGGDLKGTYGALITVSSNLTNAGKISINGELDAHEAETTNSGTIELQDNAYARIMLNGAKASLTDQKTGKGSLVLVAPAVYEMFDNFFTGRNQLAGATGIIETTLNQEDYNKVLDNHGTYNEDQETALEVLNKITVTGELRVKNTELAKVNFVLPANAKLIALEKDLKIKSLTVNGNGTELKTEYKENNKVVANKIVIDKKLDVNADLTVKANVNVILTTGSEPEIIGSNPVAKEGVLNLNNGTFTVEKNASIHGSANGAFFATIDAPATLKNKGVIGKFEKAYTTVVPDKYWEGEELNKINAVIDAYVAYLASNQVWIYPNGSWENDAQNSLSKTWDRFIAWVKADCGVFDGKLGNGNSVKLKVTDYTASDIVIATVKAGLEKYVDDEGNALLGKDIKTTYSDKILYKVVPDINVGAKLYDYIIVRNNYGTFDMLSDEIITVGGIVDNNKGTKKGEFSTNVLETGIVTIVGGAPQVTI